jgi:large subunit ribosomal protein L7A
MGALPPIPSTQRVWAQPATKISVLIVLSINHVLTRFLLTQVIVGDIIIGRVCKMEYEDIVKILPKPKARMAGLKQVQRALDAGKAAAVVLADDADDHIRRRIRARCLELGVQCLDGPTMAELGTLCRLDVGAAVACVLKND